MNTSATLAAEVPDTDDITDPVVPPAALPPEHEPTAEAAEPGAPGMERLLAGYTASVLAVLKSQLGPEALLPLLLPTFAEAIRQAEVGYRACLEAITQQHTREAAILAEHRLTPRAYRGVLTVVTSSGYPLQLEVCEGSEEKFLSAMFALLEFCKQQEFRPGAPH